MKSINSFEDIRIEKYRLKLEKDLVSLKLEKYWQEQRQVFKPAQLFKKAYSLGMKFMALRMFLRLIKFR